MALQQVGLTVLRGNSKGRPTAGTFGRFFLNTATRQIFFDDGTNWLELGRTFLSGIGYSIPFGARVTSTPGALIPNGQAVDAQITIANSRSKWIVLEKGTIVSFIWTSDSADATTDVKIYLNDILDTTLDLTGASGEINTLSIAIDIGDVLQVEVSAGTVPSDIHTILHVI